MQALLRSVEEAALKRFKAPTAPTYTIELVEATYTRWIISVHKQGVGRAEFRGDAYWQWDGNWLRCHGTRICWAELLHNALAGWHACILHAGGGAFAVLPRHPDYDRVARLWELAHMSDREAIAQLRGENGEREKESGGGQHGVFLGQIQLPGS